MRNSGSETESVPTKSSQSPLRIRSVQVEGVKELSSDIVTSHEVPMGRKNGWAQLGGVEKDGVSQNS